MTSPSWQVRIADDSDCSQIMQIWNHYIDTTCVTFTTARKTLDDLQVQTRARGPLFLVARQDARVLGFATAFAFRSGPGYAHSFEHSVLLAPQITGQGIGRALMSQLKVNLRDQGAHCLFAGVSVENPAGIQFHARLGFRVAARLPEVGFKFGRFMDLVLMQKFL